MGEDISFGIQVVALATVCVSLGFMGMSQLRLFTMVATMSKIQAELVMEMERLKLAEGSVHHQMRATQNWRDLPQEGRAVLRRALAEILAEMDAEGAVRH